MGPHYPRRQRRDKLMRRHAAADSHHRLVATAGQASAHANAIAVVKTPQVLTVPAQAWG